MPSVTTIEIVWIPSWSGSVVVNVIAFEFGSKVRKVGEYTIFTESIDIFYSMFGSYNAGRV